MLFNSLEFLVFLPAVFLVYWTIGAERLALRNALLVVASYFFYGWWDPKFLLLIALSTLIDYVVGRGLASSEDDIKRRRLLGVSLVANLGMLGVFKYFDFFVGSLHTALLGIGVSVSLPSLQLVLPVGISFYTFQTLSYTIDVYRRRVPPCSDPLAFAAFVSFFPQLVAGPIERASSLLPQFESTRRFDTAQARDGARQILWGFFKKIVIADNAAPWVEEIFRSPTEQSGLVLAIGAAMFAFQIYGDFSGYSDIAIGTAKLFGFQLMTNFRTPYFARNVGEFWRRWHISLSTWFRDYVYIPLGGSRLSKGKVVRNVFVVFLVSGFWHGANWTFVAWGALHALFFLPSLLMNRNRRFTEQIAAGRRLPSMTELSHMLATFSAVCLAWIFFRSESIQAAFTYLASMAQPTGWFDLPAPTRLIEWLVFGGLLAVMLVVEWANREREHGLDIASLPLWVRWSCYQGLAMLIVFFGAFGETQFIYFQF